MKKWITHFLYLILHNTITIFTVIIPIFIFPTAYQEYWHEFPYTCPEGLFCIIDDFRNDLDFGILFFSPIIIILIINFIWYFGIFKRGEIND